MKHGPSTLTFTDFQSTYNCKYMLCLTEAASRYRQLEVVAARSGFKIEDVPKDGDCALHAFIDQLRRRVGETAFTATSLRKSTVQHLSKCPVDDGFFVRFEFSNFQTYLQKRKLCGTWCDEIMI